MSVPAGRRTMLHEGPGWGPALVVAMLEDCRSWAAVERYWLGVVSGTACLEDIGISSVTGDNTKPQQQSEPQPPLAPASAAQPQPLAVVASNVGGGPSKPRNKERYTYKLKFSYYGPAFEGWMHQAHLRSVEGALMAALAPLLAASGKPVINVAGRTDRGVSACAQVCSFYSWSRQPAAAVQAAVDTARPGALRFLAVEQVPRSFHATFSAKWRRYVYLLPLLGASAQQLPVTQSDPAVVGADTAAADALMEAAQRTDPDVQRVDTLLRQLEGREVDYYSFARDTPKGKDCHCTLLLARAKEVLLPHPAHGGTAAPASAHPAGGPGGTAALAPGDSTTDALRAEQESSMQPVRALCVELVGTRFLRRMVRVLVSTAVRESIPAAARHAGADDALLRIAEEHDRVVTAPAAPACGLCFCEAGY